MEQDAQAQINGYGPQPATGEVFLVDQGTSYAIQIPSTGTAETKITFTGSVVGAYGWCFGYSGINNVNGDWRTALVATGQSLAVSPTPPCTPPALPP